MDKHNKGDMERNRNYNQNKNYSGGYNKNYARLDPNFSLEKSYFIKELSTTQLNSIKELIDSYFEKGKTDEKTLQTLFQPFSQLKKGEANVHALRKIIDEVAELHQKLDNFFHCYKALNDFIVHEFFTVKPSIMEVYFFPNESNEDHVVNMLRTCKKTLDIAIFSLTNDKIYNAIEEVWNNGCEVRIICDDECCKQIGSDVFKLAALGIPVKTDNSQQYHMHHKFAVIDHQVVLTGSFNWTTQAVKNNQENIIFYQNPVLAKKYITEYNNLWAVFKSVDPEEAKEKVEEEIENRKNKKYNK
jgi:phosphatidylserine/phosphatidylglycerophosphate/cardiolipin synthase-like enzyme